MKNARPAFAVALLMLAAWSTLNNPAHAGTQWKWRDASGAIQYSDRPPPPGVPEQSILARPATARIPVTRNNADAASAASAPASAASGTVDPGLDAKRKKAEEDKQARKKAEDDKIAAQKADTCQRARGYMRSLQDGMRITRTNANGEREVLDDNARAEEVQHTQDVIANNCN